MDHPGGRHGVEEGGLLGAPLDGLLDPPGVPVVTAVPQLVPELVLALHQPPGSPEGDGLHCLGEPGAEVDLLGTEAGEGPAHLGEVLLPGRLVGLEAGLGDLVERRAAQQTNGPGNKLYQTEDCLVNNSSISRSQ